MIKLNVGLVYGGNSSEWEISVKSGKNVAKHLDTQKYNVYEILLRGSSLKVVAVNGQNCSVPVEVEKNDFSVQTPQGKELIDIAFIMIHGTPGENGIFTSYLEMMNIPHTGCSARVALITFDKYLCKRFLQGSGVALARDYMLTRKEYLTIKDNLSQWIAKTEKVLGPMPWFVKPNASGSSFGVSKVTEPEQLKSALENAFTEDTMLLLEEYIKGQELTNGILKTSDKTYLLPVTEIIPDTRHSFFDYVAKYDGESQEVTPAHISAELSDRVQQLSSHIYDYLGCEGCVRMDYIVRNDDIYFLEVNTIPGMTDASLVPQQVSVGGYSIVEFIDSIIDRKLCEHKRV